MEASNVSLRHRMVSIDEDTHCLQQQQKEHLHSVQHFTEKQKEIILHSFANELTAQNNSHDCNPQYYHHLSKMSSTAGTRSSSRIEDNDRNFSAKMPDDQREVSEKANPPLTSWSSLQCSFFGFQNSHSHLNCVLSAIHRSRENSCLSSLHTRLKARIFPVTDFLEFLISLVVMPTRSKQKCRTSTFKACFAFVLLLLFSFSSLTNASEMEDGNPPWKKSRSDSSFQSWTSSELEFDLQESAESDVTSRFEFPEFVVWTGRLFRYQIPKEAFPHLKEISHYKV